MLKKYKDKIILASVDLAESVLSIFIAMGIYDNESFLDNLFEFAIILAVLMLAFRFLFRKIIFKKYFEKFK